MKWSRTWNRAFATYYKRLPLLFFSVSPCLRDKDYIPNNLDSSTTSISSGHSFQLCRQHTIMSHPFGSWPCSLKFLLSYSNSIRRCCHFPGATWRFATQSGNFPCTDSTCKPSLAATIPNSTITPSSFTGAFVIGDRSNGSPHHRLAPINAARREIAAPQTVILNERRLYRE
jgi:hypothetical protein